MLQYDQWRIDKNWKEISQFLMENEKAKIEAAKQVDPMISPDGTGAAEKLLNRSVAPLVGQGMKNRTAIPRRRAVRHLS